MIGKELKLPEWNPSFLNSNHLLNAEIARNTSPERLNRSSTFRSEITKYRMHQSDIQRQLKHSSLHLTQSDPLFMPPTNNGGQMMYDKSNVYQPGTGTDVTVNGVNNGTETGDNVTREENVKRQQHHLSLVSLAEELWSTLMSELRSSGHAIEYKDLIEISALREPHEMIVDVV
eukprot:gene29840-36961_t